MFETVVASAREFEAAIAWSPTPEASRAFGDPLVGAWTGRGLAGWQVRRVMRHMQANLDRPITLAELAALVGLSRFHFCTAFRLATGQTPGNRLTDLRIRRAAELLRNERLTITEIALEVGYETPSSFTARFRERTGLTPSEYRRLP